MNILFYISIVLIFWLIFIIKDFKKDWKNYSLIILIGLCISFIIENLLVELGILYHNLSLKIWNIPLLIFVLYIFYISFVYRIARLMKKKKIFYFLVFVSAAILGFLFDVTAINFGYYSYPCVTKFNILNYTTSFKIFDVPILAPISEGVLLLIIFLISFKIKSRINKKNKVR